MTQPPEDGMFGVCAYTWDVERGGSRRATATEKLECCAEACKPKVSLCLSHCLKHHGPHGETPNAARYTECTDGCARILLSCKSTCELVDPKWGTNTRLVDCIGAAECGSYPQFDNDCMKRNEEAIKTCCMRNCAPSSTTRCLDYCQHGFDDFVGRSENPLIRMYDNDIAFHLGGFPAPKKPPSRVWMVYVSALLLALVIFYFVQSRV